MREPKWIIKSSVNRRATYLCCGCIWITVCPVWPAVEGCDQECIVDSVLAVIAHQCGVAGGATAIYRTFPICSLNFLCGKFSACAECFPGSHIRVDY
jgi:hypothetical protein